jgi:hypothetical protein
MLVILMIIIGSSIINCPQKKMCFQLLKICHKLHIKQTIINQLELYKVDYFLLLKQLVNQHLIHDLLLIMVNFL